MGFCPTWRQSTSACSNSWELGTHGFTDEYSPTSKPRSGMSATKQIDGKTEVCWRGTVHRSLSGIEVVHRCSGEGGLSLTGSRKAGLQGVTEGHQGVDFGDDAALFRERRERNGRA